MRPWADASERAEAAVMRNEAKCMLVGLRRKRERRDRGSAPLLRLVGKRRDWFG